MKEGEKKTQKKKQNKEVTLVQVAEAWLRLKQDFDSYIFELSLWLITFKPLSRTNPLIKKAD